MRLRDGMLPAVLLGELMAGVALGAAWPRLTTPPGAQFQQVPTTAVLAPVAVPAAVAPPAAVPAAGPAAVAPVAVAPVAVAPVAVPVPVTVSVPVTAPAPAPAAVAPAHTPPGTEPAARNPFFVLAR